VAPGAARKLSQSGGYDALASCDPGLVSDFPGMAAFCPAVHNLTHINTNFPQPFKLGLG
jgi:hypothetical protein